MIGPGPYEKEALMVKSRTQAEVVVVLVLGGNLGIGVSVKVDDPAMYAVLPHLLRDIAANIQSDVDALEYSAREAAGATRQ